MKPTPLLLAACLALPSILAVVHALPAPEPTRAVVVLGPDMAFREKFKKAMEKASKPEMEKLVKGNSSAASAWIARAEEILAARPDDPEMGPFSVELSAAWKAVMKTEFPAKEKAFFAALEGQNKHNRIDLRARFDKAQADFDANDEKRDPYVYSQMVEELDVLASAFDQIGDHYFSSEAWLVYAACYDETLRGAGSDSKRALAGYEKALEERAKVDLADTKKDEAEKRKTALTARIAAGGASGGAPPGEQEPTDAGATIDVPLSFEALTTVDAFQRPCYMADDIALTWNELGLQKSGSTATFERTPGAPTLYRVGSADVRFDTDGDGKGDGPNDEKIPLTGNVTPVKIMLGRGESARPWAFLAVTAGQQENYQKVSLNLAPSDDFLRLFVVGAASVIGTLDGQPIRIVDDSMEGFYGNEPEQLGFVGLTRGVYQPNLDSIVIGNQKRARPWSEYQQVNGKWWKFEMGSNGKSIRASPVRTDTGILKLDFKGPVAPTYVIVRGTTSLKSAYFDLVEGGAKGVEVPIGRYQLAYGEVRKGKKKQLQKCVIVPSPTNSVSYDVTKGGTTVVSLGAPFSMAFETKINDGLLTIAGKSVAITGSQGEHYERTWQCMPHPEVGVRKKGTKAAAKTGKMDPPTDNKTVDDHGWDAAWFPLDLKAIDVKALGEVEVQLVDKKHDLFGKIESEWK